MSGIRISAALIVRDEEKFLEGCLASIESHVDEIVVVDTGSVDRTVDIARSFGVTLLEREWRNDFAWARNEGLDAASGDWILYIDADERLTVPEGCRLTDGLAGDDVFCSRVTFRPTINATPYREYRLFRNDPRLKFSGSMHETMLPDFDNLRATVGARFTESPAEILHLGYEGDPTRKLHRNLPLLRAALAQNPRRLYYWYHLSETLAGLGEVEEALAVSAEGLRLAGLAAPSDMRNTMAALLAITHARLLLSAGEDPLPTIDAGSAFFSDNPQLRFLRARALLDRGEIDGAIELLRALADIDSRSFADSRMAFDRRLFDVYAPDLLGVAFLRQGRRAEAAAWFARAAKAAPDEPAFRIKAQALGAVLN